MSNELIGKNIGHATAYAYAKAHGYEGTEEEFAQMLANYDTLVEQASGYADDASASATAADQAAQRISGITASTTVAGMTDTTKVYVYLGSETGYTSGNWYYYSGSAWVSGGVYQSTALVTDTTMTQSGMAADAKATGDAVTALKEDLTQINQTVTVKKLNAYIDATTQTIMADANSATYLFDISANASVIDFYRVLVTGTSNRCRLLAFTGKIDTIGINSYSSKYENFGNDATSLTLKKFDYASYNTIAIATNYQSTPVATMAVTEHHAYTVWDKISEHEDAIDGLQDSTLYPYKGSIIVADSISGDVQFNEIPSTDCEVTAIGTNLFNYATAEWGTINASTGEDDDSYTGAIRSEDYIPVEEGETLCVSMSDDALGQIYHIRLALYDEDKEFIERIDTSISGGGYSGSISISSNGAKFARLSLNFGENLGSIKALKIMLTYGSSFPAFEEYMSNTVTVDDGVLDGTLKAYNGVTTIFADDLSDLKLNVPTNVAKLIVKYHPNEQESQYTESDCRDRFRLEMREKAKRIGMNDTVVGDGAGHPVNTTITALDSIKMLCHAMSYQEIANTWSYDTKVIRTKGVVNTITMNSTLFKDTYISDLTDYYTVLGFKTGSGSTHNLVCACTSDDLDGKVLVGCVILSQVEDTASVNRPKAMKTLMDMGKALVANRSADVSSYVSALTTMTATHFTVVLLPNCSTKLLQRYDFDGSYSLLYNHSSTTFTSWSMIKLLCAMTALDFMNNLNEANAVVYSDLLIGTGAYGPLFQEGEVITNRDALSALLIPSCNQAAYFLERVVGKKILEDYGEDGFLPTT